MLTNKGLYWFVARRSSLTVSPLRRHYAAAAVAGAAVGTPKLALV